MENILDRRFILLGIASIQSIRRSFQPVLENFFYGMKRKVSAFTMWKVSIA